MTGRGAGKKPAPFSPNTKGLAVANMNPICVSCWNPDALVVMHLDGSGYFECQECNDTFHCEAVAEKLEALKAGWEKMIDWAKSYPGGIKPRADAEEKKS